MTWIRLPLLFFAISGNYAGYLRLVLLGSGSAGRLGIENDFAFLFQFFDVGIKAHFADGADSGSTHFERDPFTRFRHEELLRLQVGIKTALRLAVRVRHVVARQRLFARQITNFRHDFILNFVPAQPQAGVKNARALIILKIQTLRHL